MKPFLAAIYLDAGFDAARQVILKVYSQRIEELPEGVELRDPKSLLQEYLQGRQLPLPGYRMERISGKAHKQFFEVSCMINELDLKTRGKGTTRRDAEQDAAAAMLTTIENGALE